MAESELSPDDPLLNTARRPAASLRAADTGQPVDRDLWAASLRAAIEAASNDDRAAVLTPAEAEATAQLLDELAHLYPHEPLGDLARELSWRLYNRLGI